MLFNSRLFLFGFLPLVLACYWSARPGDHRKYILVAASYVFYGVWSVKFAVLMLATTSVDFFTAQRIDLARSRAGARAWLVTSLVANLGTLAVFKYYDFFASSFNELVGGASLPLLNAVLPIGISFYTFESMSYTIDVYRKEVTALHRFIDYAHFVTMFPRLVAGPIVRFKQMAAQLKSAPTHLDPSVVPEALHFLSIGMAKKVIIADMLAANIVDAAFRSPSSLGAWQAWTGTLGYAAQLYFDFSGYSDMAVGLALLIGFRLPRNFIRPYAATSPADFWRRWHVSLSTWLRDYLYIPLGGNRYGGVRTNVNLMVTMLLGGLWHGAHWTFVVWGGYHGVALVLQRSFARSRQLPVVLAVPLTFVLVMIGWVWFRASTLRDAVGMFGSMLGRHGTGFEWLMIPWVHAIAVVVALMVAARTDTYELWTRIGVSTKWALFTGILLFVCVSRMASPSPFLYFQF